MKKIRIMVSYPGCTSADKEIIYIENDNLTKEEISNIAYEHAIDMIFEHGVQWNWEEVKEC